MGLTDILFAIPFDLFIVLFIVLEVREIFRYMDIFKRCKEENCISETCKYRHYCRKWRYLLTREGKNKLQELQEMIDGAKERSNL